MRRRENENLWTFLRNSSSFPSFLPPFSSNTPAFFPFFSPVFSSSLRLSSSPPSVVFPLPFSRVCRCASADTRPRIAHSASSQFLPSPFTFTPNRLTICDLLVKKLAFFCLHREGKSDETFTLNPLYHSFLSPKGEEVKAKNRKQRTRALRARVGLARCTAGGEVKMVCS